MKKILIKGVCIAAAAAMVSAVLTGCGEKQSGIELKVGNWPDSSQQELLDTKNAQKDEFMSQNPDIKIVPDTFAYDTKTFFMKAQANQLPNIYTVPFTELKTIIKNGNAADITEQMKAHGFDAGLNPDLLDLTKDENGNIYGVPFLAYAQGLYINKPLFVEAGLVNDDGSVKIPSTYQEVAEFAKIISEKTGKAGIALPTTNNAGGWHFLNIAWSYGTEFAKQRDDGTWESTLNTQATKDALQYVKDLKWKQNALLSDTVLAQADLYKYFATGQAAMMFADPPCNQLSQKYGMNIDDIMVVRMPEGPAGRFTQMGGAVFMFSKNSTPEQIDAGLKWLEFLGYSPEVTEESLERLRTDLTKQIENKQIVLDQDAFDVWTNPETLEKTRSVKKEFTNIKHENYEKYYSFEDVTIKPEPAACAQELYSILDKCIQEVVTNENANVDELIETASNDYQQNHLDKMEQ